MLTAGRTQGSSHLPGEVLAFSSKPDCLLIEQEPSAVTDLSGLVGIRER